MNDNFKVVYKKSKDVNQQEFRNIDNFANAYIETTDITNAPISNLPSTPEHSTSSTTDTDGHSSNVFIMTPVLAEDSPLKETTSDPFSQTRCLRQVDNLCLIITSMIIFSISLTVALIIQIYVGLPQVERHGGIVSDDPFCSKMGFDILKMKGASTVDGTIVTALCICVTQPHAASIGGGGFAIVHDQQKSSHGTIFYNFREKSPSAFNTTSVVDQYFTGKSKKEIPAGQSIAIPGLLKGLEMLHTKYNSVVPWKTLLSPLISLARDGIVVSGQLSSAIQSLQLDSISDDLKKLVTKPDNDSAKLEAGDVLKQPALADTLELVASYGSGALYDGPFTGNLITQLQNLSSLITADDFANYKTNATNIVAQVTLGEQLVLTGGFPSIGPALFTILSTMSEYRNPTNNQDASFLQTHRLIEAYKYSLGNLEELHSSTSNNSQKLNSNNIGSFIRNKISDNTSYPLEHYLDGYQPLQLLSNGQQHVAAIGADGKVITILLNLGSSFGSKQMVSGFVLNDVMLDFSWRGKNVDSTGLPPSKANMISGNKQPMSSLVPVLIIPSGSKCGKYFAINSMFGFQSLSSMAQTIINYKNGLNINTSINSPRIYQQLEPYQLLIEDTNSEGLENYLSNIGHNITRLESDQNIGIVDAVRWTKNIVSTFLDKRGSSENVGYSF